MAPSRSGAGPYNRSSAIGNPKVIASNMLTNVSCTVTTAPSNSSGKYRQKFHCRADSLRKSLTRWPPSNCSWCSFQMCHFS